MKYASPYSVTKYQKSDPEVLAVTGGHSVGYTVAGSYIKVPKERVWKMRGRHIRQVGGFWTIGTGDKIAVRSSTKARGRGPDEIYSWSTSTSNVIRATTDATTGSTWVQDATIQVSEGKKGRSVTASSPFHPSKRYSYIDDDWCSSVIGIQHSEMSYAYSESRVGSCPSSDYQQDILNDDEYLCTASKSDDKLRAYGVPSDVYMSQPCRKRRCQPQNIIPLRTIEEFIEKQSCGIGQSKKKIPKISSSRLLSTSGNRRTNPRHFDIERSKVIIAAFDKNNDTHLDLKEFNKLLLHLCKRSVSPSTFDDLCGDVKCDSEDGFTAEGLLRLYLNSGTSLEGNLINHFRTVRSSVGKHQFKNQLPYFASAVKLRPLRKIRDGETLERYFDSLHSRTKQPIRPEPEAPQKLLKPREHRDMIARLSKNESTPRKSKRDYATVYQKQIEQQELNKLIIPVEEFDYLCRRLHLNKSRESSEGVQTLKDPTPPPFPRKSSFRINKQQECDMLQRLGTPNWREKRIKTLRSKYTLKEDPWLSCAG